MGVDAREQKCSCRVNFPKELGVKRIYLGIKFTSQSPDREAVKHCISEVIARSPSASSLMSVNSPTGQKGHYS